MVISFEEKDRAAIEEDVKLKPCPFCGESAYLIKAPGKSQVVCTYCHASTAVFKGVGAVREWNRRV